MSSVYSLYVFINKPSTLCLLIWFFKRYLKPSSELKFGNGYLILLVDFDLTKSRFIINVNFINSSLSNFFTVLYASVADIINVFEKLKL